MASLKKHVRRAHSDLYNENQDKPRTWFKAEKGQTIPDDPEYSLQNTEKRQKTGNEGHSSGRKEVTS